MTKVEDVVTKRVVKLSASEMVDSWLDVFGFAVEKLTRETHNTGKTEDLRLLFAAELERNLRFAEAVQAAKTGNSQPMLDFLVDTTNVYSFWPFEEVTKAKEDGLERELAIRFEHINTPFELTFCEDQIRLIESCF